MSSSEKDREVFFEPKDGEPLWWYRVQGDYGDCAFGPFPTEAKAIEAMQLHGLEE